MNREEIHTQAGDLNWPVAAAIRPVAVGALQVWCASLRQKPDELRQGFQRLSAEEQARAARFGTETLRHRYVASRLVLRTILAAQANQRPEALQFETDAQGKPHVAGQRGLEFNLSHSADLLLLAITRGAPVGLDVEFVRPMPDRMAIASRFFSPREAEWLGNLAEAEQDRAFFHLWTRKEAVLKATGEGIGAGLAGVEVLGSDGELAATCERPRSRRWMLLPLEPAAGFVGAVAVLFIPEQLELLSWPPSTP